MSPIEARPAATLTIDRLCLQLPHHLARRADGIARRLAEELRKLPWDEGCRIGRLTLPPQTIAPELDDRRIAAAIARAIHSQVSRERG